MMRTNATNTTISETEIAVQVALGLAHKYKIRVFYLTTKIRKHRNIRQDYIYHITTEGALNLWWKNKFNPIECIAQNKFYNKSSKDVVAEVHRVNYRPHGVLEPQYFIHCAGTRELDMYWKSKITPWLRARPILAYDAVKRRHMNSIDFCADALN